MELFSVRPKVHLIDTFARFAADFALCETDLLLTEQILHDAYAKPLNLPCRVILKDTYDKGEPNDDTVDRILQDIASWEVRRIIAMGGGSVIDIAKVLMIKGCYPVIDVIEGRTPIEPDKELIVLPTTCGTGSEVTSGGIITVKQTGLKMAVINEKLTASNAVLVPQLISGLPYPVFVYCSVDALGHSMESYVSATRGNDMARAVGARSISLILDGYADLLLHGPDYRQNLLQNFIVASCLGGMAVNNGGAGPVHALAYPVGETYKMSHGESIYQFLVPVFSRYQQQGGPLMEQLIDLLEKPLRKAGLFDTRENTFARLDTLLQKVYPPRPLRECGMKQSDIEPFADNIIANKQRLLVASYMPFTRQMAVDIYTERL